MRHRKDHAQQSNKAARAARAHGEDDDARKVDLRDTHKTGQRGLSVDSIALFAAIMAVYVRTLYPTVAGGDSGELVAESCHLGISHPPGYPLYNMIVHVLTNYSPLLAFRSKAWHANLFSAVGAEVFALNNAFTAALLYVLLRYSRERTWELARRGAWLSGLALCNQHTIVLFELPIVLWVLSTRRPHWRRELLPLSLAFLAGLSPYLYMPLAAFWRPQPGSWGDVTSLSGFIHHLRRADYGTFRLYSTDAKTEGLVTRLELYAQDLSQREVPLRLAFPLARNLVGILVAATYAFYMVVFHALANLPLSEGLTYGVHMRFWQQPNVIVFSWIGVGLVAVLDWFTSRCPARRLLYLLGHAVAPAIAVMQLTTWFSLCDQSDAWYIHNYAAALLDPLPPQAVLFVNFDLQWTALRYLQRCEHRRRDVTILNLSMTTYRWFETKHSQYPDLVFPGPRLVPYGSQSPGFTFAQFLDANSALVRERGVFFGGKLNSNDADFADRYTFVPFGLLDQIHEARLAASQPSLHDWYAQQQRVREEVRMRLPQLPPAAKYDDQTWEWTIARDHGMKKLSWSTYLLDKTIAEDPQNVSLLAEATHAMEDSYQHEPLQFWNPVATLKNLGLAYAEIIKSKQDLDSSLGDPFFNDAVGRGVTDPTRFKDRASARLLEVWGAWLRLPEAKQDPGFQVIQEIVRKFVPQDTPSSGNASKSKASKKKRHQARTKKTKKKE
ncbi:hypothetical protein P43SY_006640 [Pythium insidiosum]|uniref:Transmembrane protein n=1 Tax=Pythium insidiosum TaxID=114742 RepID=A0AAD5M8J3_PYTIN|nr:hypothetical protein P43SY_006640 [Pythium insidiosum]